MLHQAKCKKILDQIIRIAKPQKIFLFGSAARGKPPAHDLDFLIVVADQVDCRQTARNLYRLVQRVGIPTDYVVVTESKLADHEEDEWSVISSALKEGVILYVAQDS